MDLGLAGKVFIVTGGTSGLGRASAEALVAEGARVAVSSRSQEKVDQTVTALGANAVGLVADNADPDTPTALIALARDTFGRLDGALISVGGPAAGNALDLHEDAWRAAIDSVLLGGIRLGTAIGRELGEGGAIAFVLSSSVQQPIPGLATSNALRPGLAMYAKTLADELGPRDIRVVSLLPGRIATERTTSLDEAAGQGAHERNIASIPLGRYGSPEEFGRVGAFALSPAASYVSGIAIRVDGGAGRAL